MQEKSFFTEDQINALEELGGRRWQKGDYDRMYFNRMDVSRLGLWLTYYKTGNISKAWYKGEKISNCKAKRILAEMEEGRPEGAFIDIKTGEVHGSAYASKYMKALISEVKAC